MTNPLVSIETSLGKIEVELFEKEAPLTVANFLRYVDAKHYDGTIFHRVIDNFMIQGGGMDKEMKEKKTSSSIRNEADNRIQNKRGTIAMARTSDIHSATAQFFINVVDNEFLNYRFPSPSGFGYCVFGKVTSGMDVVDKIRKVKTATHAGHENVPIIAVTITKIERVKN